MDPTNIALGLGAVLSLGFAFWGMDALRGREAGEDDPHSEPYGDVIHPGGCAPPFVATGRHARCTCIADACECGAIVRRYSGRGWA